MHQHVAQPPIQPSTRAAERHEFWGGFVATLIGCLLLVAGVKHLTEVETIEGATAWETQLVRAFAHGGLRYTDALAPPRTSEIADPVRAVAVLERIDRLRGTPGFKRWSVQVDTGAKTPCPT